MRQLGLVIALIGAMSVNGQNTDDWLTSCMLTPGIVLEYSKETLFKHDYFHRLNPEDEINISWQAAWAFECQDSAFVIELEFIEGRGSDIVYVNVDHAKAFVSQMQKFLTAFKELEEGKSIRMILQNGMKIYAFNPNYFFITSDSGALDKTVALKKSAINSFLAALLVAQKKAERELSRKN